MTSPSSFAQAAQGESRLRVEDSRGERVDARGSLLVVAFRNGIPAEDVVIQGRPERRAPTFRGILSLTLPAGSKKFIFPR
ncbi:MAG: hypothetical protein HC902_13250 [Calothrix sp. SM1_5_4]|nr:hypothetical protein [Calothrix sp. SM1_5_4]